MPFFSIIIPTYNRANYLVETLQSVLNQDFTDFELLLIDDGSTDNTAQIVKDNFGKDQRLQYFQKANEERSVARNFGLNHAKGNFAVFFDSDDLMHSNHLSVLYDRIQKNPDCRFFACRYQIQEKNGKTLNNDWQFAEGLHDTQFLLQGNPIGILICLNIKPLPKYLFSPKFNICEDWIFNWQNMRSSKIYLINELTMTVWEHDQRSMRNNKVAIDSRLRATDFLKQEIPFSETEIKQLEGFSYRFCAIHAHLDQNRSQALRFLQKTIQKLGFRKEFIILLVKILLGKKILDRIKNYLKL